jgi:hypothetical protein
LKSDCRFFISQLLKSTRLPGGHLHFVVVDTAPFVQARDISCAHICTTSNTPSDKARLNNITEDSTTQTHAHAHAYAHAHAHPHAHAHTHAQYSTQHTTTHNTQHTTHNTQHTTNTTHNQHNTTQHKSHLAVASFPIGRCRISSTSAASSAASGTIRAPAQSTATRANSPRPSAHSSGSPSDPPFLTDTPRWPAVHE